MNVALNICGKNVKILSLKGRQVKQWASADLPAGLVRDGLILDTKAVGQIVNDLFKSTGMPRDKVTASVAGLSFTYRFLKLPRMKPALLEEAIIRAARKEVSLPLEDLYLSWQQLPDIGDELSFFVLGVPRNPIDAILETLEVAGVEPYLMGVRPLALARVAERSDAIIVNIEECCFDIVIMSGGIPRVIHTITPRIENATLEDNIRRLADELTKTAAFYQSNNKDMQLDNSTPLLLTGDWAANSPASALLQTEVEYPIQSLIAQVEVPKGLPMDSYAAVIGLALKKAPSKTEKKIDMANFVDVNVNILAGKYRKPKAKPVSPAYVWLGILLAAAVILLYPLYQVYTQAKTENAALETALTDIQRQVNIAIAMNEENTNIEKMLQSETTAADAVKKAYAETIGTRGNFTSNLEIVTSLAPAQTIFTTLEINPDEISIHGETFSVFTVVDYATALEAAGVFYEVRINEIDEGPSAVYLEEGADTAPVNVIKFEIVITKYAPGSN